MECISESLSILQTPPTVKVKATVIFTAVIFTAVILFTVTAKEHTSRLLSRGLLYKPLFFLTVHKMEDEIDNSIVY